MALGTQPATIGGAPKTLIVALDGSGNLAAAHVNVGADGVEKGTVGNPLIVAPAAGAMAITATVLPLPAGAAQDGTDATGIAAPGGGIGIRGWLSGIYARLGSPLTVVVQGTVPVSGSFSQTTQPVSAVSLPLPSGAAMDGADAAGSTMPSGGAGIRGWLSGIYGRLAGTLVVQGAAGGVAIKVDGSGATQPVSLASAVAVTGSFYPATQPVSLSVLPALSAGAATIGAVTQSGGPWTVSWSGQSVGQSGTWTVGLATGSSVTLGAGSAAIGSVSVTGSVGVTGTFFQATQPVSAASLPLPSGAAQDGTDATGVTAPSGAVGIRGWLSSIFFGIGTPADASWPGTGPGTLVGISKSLYGKLAGVLSVTINGSLPAGTNLLGSVNVNGTQTVDDIQSRAYQSATAITPGTPLSAGRTLGYICTTAGNITLTLPTGTLTLPITTAGGAFQTLPFAVTNVALGSGTAGSFWNLA